MKHVFSSCVVAVALAGVMTGCTKNVSEQQDSSVLSQDELNLVSSAGFNKNWVEKRSGGKFLIEGDLLLDRSQLMEMVGKKPSNSLIVAEEEHYVTYNLVSVPGSGSRTITVALGNGFPSYYSTALDKVIARYNSYNLKITFQRVSSGADITISGSNLGTSGGGCILGQASGFPSASGNPSPGFTLSTSSCATTYINTEEKADEVMAHEMGHCIGFRHTDYKKRQSCGRGAGESAGSIGAVYVPGTPTFNVSSGYDSWMMACTNGKANFNGDDIIALQYIY